ncbi:ribosylnicotinamide kinase [Entomophthora muscae]|uniref:Ribosylnicotinamide kinase n=1 Tax=Entomophthora muscae TaxID=34485 RepID=A0ACC2THW5_9FUNG|nr:ribosylnicotinamide kinase [Entomophthora muscae]
MIPSRMQQVGYEITSTPESAKKVFDPSTRYIIVEGFLFFHDPKFLSLLDGAILAWADYPTLLERREARPGYETKEGFWADPPQYFEKVVWPSFRTFYHSFTSDSIDNVSPAMFNSSSLSPCPPAQINHPGLNWTEKYVVIRTDSSKPLGHSSLEIISHLASIL